MALAISAGQGINFHGRGRFELARGGKPPQGVDRMAAADQESADALGHGTGIVPARPPTPVVAQVIGFDVIRPPDRAVGQQRLEHGEQRVPAEHEADHRPHARRADRLADRDDLFQADAGRLLQQDVLAGAGRGHRMLAMQVLRSADRNDIHAGMGQGPLGVVVAGHVAQTRRAAPLPGRFRVRSQMASTRVHGLRW